jgi:hypothetical protein
MELGFMLVLIDSILDTLDEIKVHLHFGTHHCLVHVKFISSKKKTSSKQKQKQNKTKQPIEKQIKHIS